MPDYSSAEKRYLEADFAYKRAVQQRFAAESDLIKAERERRRAYADLMTAAMTNREPTDASN